jgi:hypothetical protein
MELADAADPILTNSTDKSTRPAEWRGRIDGAKLAQDISPQRGRLPRPFAVTVGAASSAPRFP